MNMTNSLPVDHEIHRECHCHECATAPDPGVVQDAIENMTLVQKLKYHGLLRFAGWWSIFAGALAVNSVCPICGTQGCPVGIGTTGIIAAFFAGLKQWGIVFFKKTVDIIRTFFRNKTYLNAAERGIIMDQNFNASEIKKGYHPEGYRIDKTASPMDFYTKWEITPEGKWINPKPTCFDSMPQEGWHKTESF